MAQTAKTGTTVKTGTRITPRLFHVFNQQTIILMVEFRTNQEVRHETLKKFSPAKNP
jgi:hypothetical protein